MCLFKLTTKQNKKKIIAKQINYLLNKIKEKNIYNTKTNQRFCFTKELIIKKINVYVNKLNCRKVTLDTLNIENQNKLIVK